MYKKGVELDLVLQMQHLNQSLTNISRISGQLDESVASLEALSLYHQFLQRKA